MNNSRDTHFCNPLDLTYRYQDVSYGDMGRVLYREAADPSVVLFRDRYYMFASMCGGFYSSENLASWQYHPTESIPALDYAPDARVIDGAIYLCASRDTDSPFFRSEDPIGEGFSKIADGSLPFWDPNLFQDDDGRTYLYWGCSNNEPTWGAEVSRNNLRPIGAPTPLISADTERHGWERPGENNELEEPTNEYERGVREAIGTDPFVEGSWMTRSGATYYLQYSAPGTEWNTYADGIYTGKSALGPFEYSNHNPFSSKPGGFVTGAGHGSTFQDRDGKWWHAATMRISVSHPFERRIGLFPANIDEDGVLFCNQNFADFPMGVSRQREPGEPITPDWMLLSHKKPTAASSSAGGHGPELACNEDIRTWWTAGTREPGEWIEVDLGADRTIHALQVNLADDGLANIALPGGAYQRVGGVDRLIDPREQPSRIQVETSTDGKAWQTVNYESNAASNGPHAFVVLPTPRAGRYVRVTALSIPYGAPFSVSGLRIFGTAEGASPAKARLISASRIDELSAAIKWEPSLGAHGYNVRFGIAPTKLYHSFQLFDQTSVKLTSLNAGVPYWVAVDSFGETGVTAGDTVEIYG